MKTIALLGLVLLLAGCGRNPIYAEADYRVLCSIDGHAFSVEPGAGATSFVRRSPDSDALCARGLTK